MATYNIHRCHGLDNTLDPGRINEVLLELDADIIGLQEVDSGIFVKNGSCQAEHVSRLPGYDSVTGPTIKTQIGRYGNVLLSRWPIVDYGLIDLGIKFREPRGAIRATIDMDGKLVNVVNLHLGLGTFERRIQYRILSSTLRKASLPLIIMGDFNEWSPLRRSFSSLGFGAGGGTLVRSFPSWRPLLSLDRIYVNPESVIQRVEVHRSELSRIASDHLPVKAHLAL